MGLWVEVGKRRWLKKILLSRMPERVSMDVGGLRLSLAARDFTGPSFYVMYGGSPAFDHYEKLEKDEILRALPKDGVFLDLGANVGLFSFYTKLHRPDVSVYAFEPHPLLFSCLKATQEQNLLSGFQPIQAAIGDRSGEMTLHLHPADSGGHSLLGDSLAPGVSTAAIPVKITTLDQFLEEQKPARVDVIKMDVQGFEPEVITGARRLLERFNPVFLIECDNQRLLTDDGSLIKNLSASRYRWKEIGPDAPLRAMGELSPFAKSELARKILYTNYLFAPATT
ncbi:MAG: FkbM family methyltransferase [Bdellovibrionota bacterium]